MRFTGGGSVVAAEAATTGTYAVCRTDQDVAEAHYGSVKKIIGLWSLSRTGSSSPNSFLTAASCRVT
ncbi:hypothetical protein SAMN05428940_5614 [Streptomyces sp. 2133.1]|nr:hypothetical protein BX261_5588 [Streptomyces sp. 2321.6]SED72235.1 hypothetical protein SAMN05428940_5614 [Streptomyces sp. 2133.1]SNC72148.1 hypothetical protein SAMN06272741_5515 [Streptomyces sp. 2114.4]